MKRFWDEAKAEETADGWRIALDGKPVMTPGKNALLLPSEQLGYGIAAEWNGQEGDIDPRSMPLTGLANAAIDIIAPDLEAFAGALAEYGETDLLCYRADNPRELQQRQCEAWDPMLDWATKRYDVSFETTTDIVHRPQPGETVERLGAVVRALDPFRLAALDRIVRIAGSLVAGLALAEGAFEEAEVWDAIRLDEDWQEAQWGEDKEVIAARDAKRRDFAAAMRFLRLLGN